MRERTTRGSALSWLAVLAAIVLLTGGAVAWRTRDAGEGEKAPAEAAAVGRPAASAADSGVATVTPVPPVAAPVQVTPPAPEGAKPKRGPGAVLAFDPAAAPLVPADLTPDTYVTLYYDRVMAGDFENAWAMLPKEASAQTMADYLILLSGYEPEGYFVTDVVEDEAGTTVSALQFGADNRSYTTTWAFVATDKGLALKDVTYALPSGGACH